MILYNIGRKTAAKSTYLKGWVSCFADKFVQAESSVLQMKFSGKNPALQGSRAQNIVMRLFVPI